MQINQLAGRSFFLRILATDFHGFVRMNLLDEPSAIKRRNFPWGKLEYDSLP